MGQAIEALINDCIRLEYERNRLLLIQLAFDPPSTIKKDFGMEIPKELRTDLIKDARNLGGIHEVREKYNLTMANYDNRLSETAEILEQEGFVVEKFQEQLNNEQFAWLISHVEVLKNHLKGIEI